MARASSSKWGWTTSLTNERLLGASPTEIFLGSSDRYPGSTPIAATSYDVARFLLLIWFFVVLLPFANGTTVGKRLLGMRAVKTDGERAGFFTMLIRELIVKYIVVIPIALGLLWIIWDEDRQGWHDKIMNTWVVAKSEDVVEESGEDDGPNAPSVRLEDMDAYRQ